MSFTYLPIWGSVKKRTENEFTDFTCLIFFSTHTDFFKKSSLDKERLVHFYKVLLPLSSSLKGEDSTMRVSYWGIALYGAITIPSQWQTGRAELMYQMNTDAICSLTYSRIINPTLSARVRRQWRVNPIHTHRGNR